MRKGINPIERPREGSCVFYETTFFTSVKNRTGYCEVIKYHKNLVWIEVISGIDHVINLDVIKFFEYEEEV